MELTIHRITSNQDPLFDAVWDIYLSSFPLCEQRTPEHQQTALRSERYHLDCYLEGEQVVGLLGYWDFPDYLYIEHFAVNPACRNGGHGGRILDDLIRRTPKTVIIEIDPLTDEISRRRHNFYTRHGFVMTDHKHPLHRYQPHDHEEMDLLIMSHPEGIDKATYERFNNDMHNVVMRRD